MFDEQGRGYGFNSFRTCGSAESATTPSTATGNMPIHRGESKEIGGVPPTPVVDPWRARRARGRVRREDLTALAERLARAGSNRVILSASSARAAPGRARRSRRGGRASLRRGGAMVRAHRGSAARAPSGWRRSALWPNRRPNSASAHSLETGQGFGLGTLRLSPMLLEHDAREWPPPWRRSRAARGHARRLLPLRLARTIPDAAAG